MHLKRNILIFFVCVIMGPGILVSCLHEPAPPSPNCKVDGVTYENYIKYMVEDKCLGCHTANSIQPVLDTYPQVMVIVNDGRLKNVITGAPGYMLMPYNSDRLPDCMIGNIVSWVESGAPEE